MALPHCDSEGVKLEDTHAEPLGLNVTEEEDDGVQDGDCEPLGLLLIEPLFDAVPHALCVALPHCEREGEALEEAHAEPLRLSVTEVDKVGVKVGD